MKNSATYRFILSGGGTGGHLFPAIAIAKALEERLKPNVEILFIGAKGRIETVKIPELGYKIVALDTVGMPRNKDIFKMMAFVYKILVSLFVVKKTIKKFKPHAVIGVGGYASFSCLYMAQRMKIPTFIQEQNAFVGIVNKALASKTVCFFGGYKEVKNLPACNFMYTGNPVRKIFHSINAIDKKAALKSFRLDPNKKTLLIIGGSQGSVKINDAILAIAEDLRGKNIQLLWQTGSLSFDKIKTYAEENGDSSIYPLAFIDNIEDAYAASDLVIGRAGALSIAELCIAAKPSILIPLPTAAEDHQTYNAAFLAQKKAAIHLPEKEMNKSLLSTIIQAMEDESLRRELSKNIKKLAIEDADDKIASAIIERIKL